MKRTVLLLSLTIFFAAALCFGVPYSRMLLERSRRHAAYADMLANSQPVVLDAATQSIMDNADRVETFRLVDFHEQENYTPEERAMEERAMVDGSHPRPLDDYTVLYSGPHEGKVYAAMLREALSQTPSPFRRDGLATGVPSCFDPGVGFRVWAGKSHVDLCVCFYCSGIQIITAEASHKPSTQMTILGPSRTAYLKLAQQVFPQDKRLAALKPEVW